MFRRCFNLQKAFLHFRFGAGPHHVKFNIELPDILKTKASFTMELFPLEKMPHSIHLFLEQVDHGLWDDCEFFVNSPHLLQAGPDEKQDKMTAFEEMGLAHVDFQEYNHDYSHQQWTVGFSGRPGGPDIYINKEDNSKVNGPNERGQYVLSEEADPCFGIVNEGRDVLNKIYSLPTSKANGGFALQKPVRIIKAEILVNASESREATHDLKDRHFHDNILMNLRYGSDDQT